LFDLCLDLGNAAFDLSLLASAVNNGGVLLGDLHLLRTAEHFEANVLELDAEVFRDHLATGQDRDVFQHCLAAIAEARSLYGSDLQAATQLVDDERSKSFAFYVFSDDDERLRGLNDSFEDRQHCLQVRQLLLVEQDVCVFEFSNHLVRVGDEVRRQVAAVELHAFDDFQLGLSGFGFLDGDDTLIADLLHGVGDHLADFLLAVSRDGANLCNFFRSVDLLRGSSQLCDNVSNSEVDTALQVHRVHASGNSLVAFLNDCLGENGRSRGAVTSDVVGLRSNFADQLGAHVLELVFQLDFLGNRTTVLGDARCAEGLVDDDVTALRTKRYLDSVGEDVDAAQHALAGITGKTYFFSSH